MTAPTTTRFLPDVDLSRRVPADLVLPPLTPMQSLVARGYADCLPRHMIADRLGITERAVREHLRQIRDRLGMEPGKGLRIHVARWVWERAR